MDSPGIATLEGIAQKETYGYVKDSKQHKLFTFYKTRLEKARDVRSLPREEWDNLDFESYILFCRQTKNSYLRPKINDKEVRVGSADVEKKVESVANEIVTLNLQPEIIVYDKNDKILQGLGQDFEDLVKKTNQIEKDDDVWQEAIMSVLSYPMTVIEECYLSKKVGYGSNNKTKMAHKNLLHPSQVFFGDIFLPYYRLNEQPYIIKYEKMTYFQAEKIWGDLENWKYVVPGQPNQNNYNLYNFTYRFSQLGEDEVEILHYYSYPDDEYMPQIQGVMMYDEPVSYKKEFGDYCGYHFTVGGIKTFSNDFIYFKSLVSSARVLANVKQEVLRLIIRKYRLAIEPVLGVAAGKGKIFNRNVWEPGNVVQGVTANDFSLLNQWNRGIDQGDTALLEIIDKTTNDMMGVDPMFQGSSAKKLTATQTQEQMKQALKMLGLAVVAVMRLKRDMTYLRIYTLQNHYFFPKEQKKINGVLQNVYPSFSINDTYLDEGKKGQKKIVMHEDDSRPYPWELKQAYQKEREASTNGMNLKHRFLNAKYLRTLPLIFYVSVDSAERDGSNLQKVMFNDLLSQATELVKASNNTKQINVEKFADKLERTWKERDLFMDATPPPQPEQPPQGEDGGGDKVPDSGMADQMGKGLKRPQQPSVKQLGSMINSNV